jgi:cytochrome c5
MQMRRLGASLGATFVLSATAAWAQGPSGEAVYKQNCAACHDGTVPRIPSRARCGS